MKNKEELVKEIYENTKNVVLDHYFKLIMNGGEGGTLLQKKSSRDLQMKRRKT